MLLLRGIDACGNDKMVISMEDLWSVLLYKYLNGIKALGIRSVSGQSEASASRKHRRVGSKDL